MKKLILLAAFGVAGLVSAKTTDVVEEKEVVIEKFLKEKNLSKEEVKEMLKPQYWYWFTICGSEIAYIFDEPSFFTALDQAKADQTRCESSIDPTYV